MDKDAKETGLDASEAGVCFSSHWREPASVILIIFILQGENVSVKHVVFRFALPWVWSFIAVFKMRRITTVQLN